MDMVKFVSGLFHSNKLSSQTAWEDGPDGAKWIEATIWLREFFDDISEEEFSIKFCNGCLFDDVLYDRNKKTMLEMAGFPGSNLPFLQETKESNDEIVMVSDSADRYAMKQFKQQLSNQIQTVSREMPDRNENINERSIVMPSKSAPCFSWDPRQVIELREQNIDLLRIICYYQKFPSLRKVESCENLETKQEFPRFQMENIKDLKQLLQDLKEEVQNLLCDWEEQAENFKNQIQALQEYAWKVPNAPKQILEFYCQGKDLKGSVSVLCRVRPLLKGQTNCQSSVGIIGKKAIVVTDHLSVARKETYRTFRFNRVFGPSSSQGEIFQELQPLIGSILDGTNVCIFAYGPTSSGKTYSMSGPTLLTKETYGLNYRALRELILISRQRMEVIAYQVCVQMVEIYNEQVRDLLAPFGTNKKLELRYISQQSGFGITCAKLIPIRSTLDVKNLINLVKRNRIVGSTDLNGGSSRSHCVLTVHVRGTDLRNGSVVQGCLHLVDLAGSERVNRSKATGLRLQEAKYVNRSLSALGDVMAALAQRKSHIPYRNSALTLLLRRSLEGQAKTVMLTHIGPEAEAYDETISTLRFAERVTTIVHADRSCNEEGI